MPAPLGTIARFAPCHNKSIPMNEQGKVDKTRRNLIIATSVAGGAAGVGAAVPFVWSMFPSEPAKAAGAPVDIDLSNPAAGALGIFEWPRKTVPTIKRN